MIPISSSPRRCLSTVVAPQSCQGMRRMGRAKKCVLHALFFSKPIDTSWVDDGFRKSAQRKNALVLYPSYDTHLTFMDRINPRDLLRFLNRLDIEIDHNGLVVAAHKDAFERLVRIGVDFLVRHVGRHENEIAGPGLGDEFEPFSPAHARAPTQHIDDAFERAMVMRAGLGIGLDCNRTRPDFLRAGAGEIDGDLAVHARRLRRIAVERMARDHAHAIKFPFCVLHFACFQFGSVITPPDLVTYVFNFEDGTDHSRSSGGGPGNGVLIDDSIHDLTETAPSDTVLPLR